MNIYSYKTIIIYYFSLCTLKKKGLEITAVINMMNVVRNDGN